MVRYAKLSALLGMLALASAQTTTTTSTSTTTSDGSTTTTDGTTTTSDVTTVVPTTVTTSVTTVIDSTTTTVSSETVISTTITVTGSTTDDATSTTDATTVITTTTFTDVTTVSDSTTTVTQSPTETVTTVTITPSSTLTSTSSSSTTSNAPQYTGATFHIESSEGDLGEGATEAGTTRQDLVFGIRTEFTLDGFGYLVSKADGSVAQTNGGGDTVFTDTRPNSRVKRQATGTPLVCSVGTNGVLFCTGAMGDVFYTDGTNLYLGDAVPAGFTPIVLIAVIDAPLVGTTSGTVSPTGPLPTAGPTTPGYAGWGQWSYPTITGVPVALTTSCVYPVSGGLVTETVTITSMHCGCTETAIPSTVEMTTYLTTCPDSWGYTSAVTVVVPVMPTGAVWATATYGSNNGGSGWSAYASGPSGSKPTGGATSGNSTYNSWNSKPYTGAASAMGASAGILSLSAAMLALFL